ncbi:MAG: preprotein translocase subunit SecG [FCB group bacterium]|jgi:protein translocase SecG subunit
MYTILTILIIFGAVLIIAAVLLQPGKGDLTATFGGISAQFGAVFGMQRANDLLAKITKWIAVIVLILVLLTNKFFLGKEEVKQIRPVTQGAQIPVNKAAPLRSSPMQMPGQGQGQQGQGQDQGQ